MSLDPAAVRRIARLARIRVTDEEATTLGRELTAILGWVEQLAEVDVSGIEPLAGPAIALRLREDVVTDGGIAPAILANAPARAGDWFAVPKVVE
jgi:aspartyl-tRNA(Asn)/glutamyl-tRNA(Gln) amidotransferase subunit C